MGRKGFAVSMIAALIVTGHILRVGGLGALRLSQVTGNTGESEKWLLDTSFGLPIRIASGFAPINQQYKGRVMFLFIEDQYCSPDFLRTVFTGLAARYQEPEALQISVYSDAEMLRRAMVRRKWPASDFVFPDTPEGVELEKRIYGEAYIPKTGWARAGYYRESREGAEKFFYKQDPQKVEMVEVVLKPRPRPKYTGDPQADLFLACRLDDVAKAKALIDNGVRIDYRNEFGETALVRAVAYNDVEILKLLLARGAYVDAKNQYGQTALNEAISHGFHEIVKVLLEHNADVNARYGPGISPLHLAAYKGDADAVDALLSKGADPNAVDADGKTPIFDAIRTRKSRIVRALLNSGAWVNIKNKHGQTPHLVAKEIGDQAIIALLRTRARQPR
ncbi:MAG: ankyrin repeat domain-containing protein [Acidobacteriota bacterium]